ncbi:MAG: hypothetical protein A2289_15605 [Deltaproteobacteria bacterium RIFOXYA12_FULL_58_15]|nr:MAG: hypothetical protein A2289_15605 [Deltaproteobacteria bacterium RIFOXYA12_FULL_58_15]OGR09792.1 MAG: hypothetical protein A2341_28700 [Deltaproteobacteria bacterium RIFOXYB12_FULL_58_9]
MLDLHGHLDAFGDEPDEMIGLTALGGFVKQSSVLNDVALNRYGISNDLRLNGTRYGRRFSERYFDATYNFCLTHEGHLIASLGFDVDMDDGTMTIWQLQGKKGASDALRPIKWERALVHHAVCWARAHEFSEVAMASVDNVSWARQHGHLQRDRGGMLYDVTARRSGFTRGNDGYWFLQLDIPCRAAPT